MSLGSAAMADVLPSKWVMPPSKGSESLHASFFRKTGSDGSSSYQNLVYILAHRELAAMENAFGIKCMPHPKGMIYVDYKVKNGVLTAIVELPDATTGNIKWNGIVKPIYPGRNILKLKP